MKSMIALFLMLVPSWFALTCNKSSTTEHSSVEFRGLAGEVVLIGVSTREELAQKNCGGVQVEVVGTLYRTTTDAAGSWKMPNIPAGRYEILLTRSGFDSVKISDINYNGKDSLFVKWINKDKNGTKSVTDKVTLVELPGNVTLRAIDPAITRVLTAKDNGHGTIYYDTTYSIAGYLQMTISLDKADITLNNGLDIKFMLSTKAVLDASDYPPDSTFPYGSDSRWTNIIGFNEGEVLPDGLYSLADGLRMTIDHYFQIHKLSINDVSRLYLHAYPIWKHSAKNYAYDVNGKDFSVNVSDKYLRGLTTSMPVLVK